MCMYERHACGTQLQPDGCMCEEEGQLLTSAAGDAFLAVSGVKFSLVRYEVRMTAMILGGMLSLSYVLSFWRKSCEGRWRGGTGEKAG